MPDKKTEIRLKGGVTLEEAESAPADLALKAFVFNESGQCLGTGDVTRGSFDLPVVAGNVRAVEVFIGPADADPEEVRRSSAPVQKIKADKIAEKITFTIPKKIWDPFRPIRVCVTGHVRKVRESGGYCPVPYVKVEVFDVDREGCFWPYILKWKNQLANRKVIRVPDLMTNPKFPPHPVPEPDPVYSKEFSASHLNPSGLATIRTESVTPFAAANTVNAGVKASILSGEIASLAKEEAAPLTELTLTSRIPPWIFFPRCFYSRKEVCETVTDNTGYFRCCFRWWPLHIRRGRLRFDPRPDIIIRVTQVINGVERVIYMDPYTSTRWNVTNTHIDLFLDDPDIVCGTGDSPAVPEGTQTFFVRIGNDLVHDIYQSGAGTGRYHGGGLDNVAYGDSLHVFAQFGDLLCSGTPLYYYRLSYSSDGTHFTTIDYPITDTRVDKATMISESYTIGPKTASNGESGLFEIRDMKKYFWYNSQWIGFWNTHTKESGSAGYILKLEVYDKNGVKLTSAKVDYRDGTAQPGLAGGLPVMPNACDLKLQIDNNDPALSLEVPGVLNECGLIPWTPALDLIFNISGSQTTSGIHSWQFDYRKGVNPTVKILCSGSSNNGLPKSFSLPSVSGAPLLAGLTTTCAFALKLSAWAHVRNGYGWVHYNELIKAIAIQKCP